VPWQELGVALIVFGALAYLGRRLFVRPRPKAPVSFVPLSSLRTRK